ncbi:MAG: 4'-phosphopantetheinyl transferase superfamily protein [Steroidobacteraceae bacterium]
MVRTVLSRYCRVAPEAWQFVEDAHGRPDVLNGVAAASGITFNISHSTGAIACAVTRATTIGIDLESIARQPLPLDVAMAHFSVAEVESLNTATVSAQAPLFFAYWTLKEAYLKAIGKGLSVPLNQLRFDLREQRHIHVSFDIPLADDSERWQFLLFRIFAEHLLAICVPRDAMTKNAVIVRKAIPLSTDQIVDVELLRQSPALPVVSLQL